MQETEKSPKKLCVILGIKRFYYKKMLQSMSGVGQCIDDRLLESFGGILKSKM